jgi:hypothetical protein
VEINLNTKARQRGYGLVFVFKLISTFIGQNPKLFFMHVLKKDFLLVKDFLLSIAREKQT